MKKSVHVSLLILTLCVLSACENPFVANNVSSEIRQPVATTTPTVEPSMSTTDTKQIPALSDEELQNTVFYTEEITREIVNDRSWPIERIWRQTPGTEPIILADRIGGVNEYLQDIKRSSDGKTLYINLESKVVSMNIETGEQKQLFVPRKQVNNFILSDDGTSIYIWDQIYASPNDFEIYVHDLDLSTGIAKQLSHIQSNPDNGYYFLDAVRPDKKSAVVTRALGEAAQPMNLDFATGVISQIGNIKGQLFPHASPRGTYLLANAGTIADPCIDFMGSELSTYQLVDSLSGAVLKTVGDSTRALEEITIAPDESEIVYATAAPRVDAKNCNEIRTKSYFKVSVSGAKAVPLSLSMQEALKLLSAWYPENAYSTQIEGDKRIVYKNGSKLFEVPKGYKIWGAHY